MDIFDNFATDEKKEIEGAWFPLSKTAKVLVARGGNENYLQILRKKLEASGIDLAGTTKEDEKAAEAVFIDAMATTILVGWEGLSFQGESLPYSTENARKLLAVKDFRKKVSAFSENFGAFKAKAERELGND
ncbi:hypothetical protein J7E62_02820 [Variovorax paradoxus]|nr:hypothetical protein [Variovorax paradoxus]